VSAGVSVKNEAGQIYDRFRDRVTFPITNYQGEVVGFSARSLKDANEAKYINSPETEIYNKSKVLFGLSKAKDTIRKNQEVIVVEGQMDVISAHQAGFANVVASSGTALTETQLVVLGRLTKNAKFCFDKDTAGSQATLRAGSLALSLGFKVKIIQLPEGKDPDELIRSHKELWEKAVTDAPWLVDFYIDEADKRFKTASVEQTQYVSQFIIPFVKYFSDPLEQDFYVKKIADHFAMKEQTIRQILQATALEVLPQEQVVSSNMPPQINPLEKEVLGGLLQYPDLSDQFKDEIRPEDFTNAQIKEIITALLSDSKIPLDNEAETIAKEAQFMVESELDSFE
jgi:DNA primase